MYKGTLKKPDGTVLIEFDIPKDLSELPLNRFIDFLVECRKMDDDDVNTAEIICRAVGAFTGAPLVDVLQANFESLNEEGLVDSVSKIFGYALKMIGDAKGSLMTPETASFKYQGETFVIPVILQQAIAGEVILPGLSTIDVIEVAEVHRFKSQVTNNKADPDGSLRKKIQELFLQNVKEHGDPDGKAAERQTQVTTSEIERRGDPDGSLLFTTYLKTLAILARKDGEQLPINDSEREIWIQTRAAFFMNIDAATALNIDFFLTSILRGYGVELRAVGFLSRQSFAAVAAISLKNVKHSIGRRRTLKTSLKRSAGVK